LLIRCWLEWLTRAAGPGLVHPQVVLQEQPHWLPASGPLTVLVIPRTQCPRPGLAALACIVKAALSTVSFRLLTRMPLFAPLSLCCRASAPLTCPSQVEWVTSHVHPRHCRDGWGRSKQSHPCSQIGRGRECPSSRQIASGAGTLPRCRLDLG